MPGILISRPLNKFNDFRGREVTFEMLAGLIVVEGRVAKSKNNRRVLMGLLLSIGPFGAAQIDVFLM